MARLMASRSPRFLGVDVLDPDENVERRTIGDDEHRALSAKKPAKRVAVVFKVVEAVVPVDAACAKPCLGIGPGLQAKELGDLTDTELAGSVAFDDEGIPCGLTQVAPALAKL